MTIEQWSDADSVANAQRDQRNPASDTPFGHQLQTLLMTMGAIAEAHKEWWDAKDRKTYNYDPLLVQVCALISQGMIALCTIAPDADRIFARQHRELMIHYGLL